MEHGSMVVYTSASFSRLEILRSRDAASNARAFDRALASACVFPGSSREYPVDKISG